MAGLNHVSLKGQMTLHSSESKRQMKVHSATEARLIYMRSSNISVYGETRREIEVPDLELRIKIDGN